MASRSALILAGAILAGCSNAPDPDPGGVEPYARYLGALELARAGNPEDIERLKKLLEDPDPFVRSGAVVAFGSLGDPRHVPLIIEMTYAIVADGEVRNTPLVRSEACRVLAQLGDPSAVEALLSVLRGDEAPEVRRVAARALETFAGRPGVLEALVRALSDRDVSVAQNAWVVLRRVSGRDDLRRDHDAWAEWLKNRAP